MLVLALMMGIVAGLRAMTPLAAVSWGAWAGDLAPPGWLEWLASGWAPWLFTVLAIAELVSDQLPRTPSRKVPVQFATRVIAGLICGVAVAGAEGAWLGGALGAIGAVIGTLGGAAARARLARAFGRDLPAALIEDAVAIATAAALIVAAA